MTNAEMLEVTCKTLRNNKLDEIADAIEQLVRERDAAVADLREWSTCVTCANSIANNGVGSRCEFVNKCFHGTNCWEWRGVQDG